MLSGLLGQSKPTDTGDQAEGVKSLSIWDRRSAQGGSQQCLPNTRESSNGNGLPQDFAAKPQGGLCLSC